MVPGFIVTMGIEPTPLLVASWRPSHYIINYLQNYVFDKKGSLLPHNSQAEPGTIPRLNLGNIPAIAGKTKLGQIPAIAGGKPCYSRDLSWEYISLL